MRHIYSNEYNTYEIKKFDGVWRVIDLADGLFAEGKYKTLKEAKKAIDNQEIYF